jgi:hypothetical protein
MTVSERYDIKVFKVMRGKQTAINNLRPKTIIFWN